jgi:hypothetical protein
MQTSNQKLGSQALFRRSLLLALSEREALSLFPASCAFLSVIPAFAVSHNSQHSATYIKPQTSKILP